MGLRSGHCERFCELVPGNDSESGLLHVVTLGRLQKLDTVVGETQHQHQ